MFNKIRQDSIATASTRLPGNSTTPCIRLWRGMAILWNGTCVPCCYDLCGSTPVGDLTGRSLEDVWLGEELTHLRALHSAGRLQEIELCRSCNKVNMNVPAAVAGIASTFLGYMDVLRLLPVLEKFKMVR